MKPRRGLRRFASGLALCICWHRALQAPGNDASFQAAFAFSAKAALAQGAALKRWAVVKEAAAQGENAGWPFVSIQIVTFNRSLWLQQAIQQIEVQDYPGRLEVVVMDDSPTANELVSKSRVPVRYFHLPERYTIGEKRNMAVSAARESGADIVCIWDDDDIFTVDRLRQQVSRMLARNASCSSIQVAFVAVLPQGKKSGVLQRCKGMPLPFENSFCFRTSWLNQRPQFTNSSLGEGNVLFEDLGDWYSEAQPIAGEEVPFLYVRTAASTAPDDALEPYEVRSMLLSAPKEGAPMRLDFALLALARALRRERFPLLEEPSPGAAALSLARAAVKAAMQKDLEGMSANVRGALQLAPGYWKALCASGSGFGPGGEAPEGSRNPSLTPCDLGATSRPLQEAAPEPEPTPEDALLRLRAILQTF